MSDLSILFVLGILSVLMTMMTMTSMTAMINITMKTMTANFALSLSGNKEKISYYLNRIMSKENFAQPSMRLNFFEL